MSQMSAGMAVIIPCVLLLLTSGAVSSYQVENGTLGGSVYFYESIPIQANAQITWSFKNVIIAQHIPGTTVCREQFVGRCDLSANGTLRVDRLTFADEGNYSMLAQYPDLTTIKTSIFGLRVFEMLNAPVLTSNGTNNRLANGTYGSLYCDASSQKVTTYTFNRDAKNICSEPRVACNDAYLYFQPVTESDGGNYTCSIQNPASSNISNTLQLTISVRVSDVKLNSNHSGLVWPGLDYVSLSCSAQGTEVSYSWSMNGAPLPQDPRYQLTDNNKVLTISPVSLQDNGIFTCTASNWINSQTSNGVNFTLAIPVSDVKLTSNHSGVVWPGQDYVSLTCSAQGTDVRYSWSMNGTPLPQGPRYQLTDNNTVLTISPVSVKDNGTFTCTATNWINRQISNGVNFPLAIVPEAPEHNNDTIINSDTGSTVVMTVTLKPGLPANFTWYRFNPSSDLMPIKTKRDLSVESTNSSSTLRIHSVTQEDNGQYVCRAENIIGSQSFLFTVTVAESVPPPGGLNGGEIAGIVIGVLAAVVLIGILVFFIVKKK